MENEKNIKEVENKLAYVLGLAYTRIPWKKIQTKSAYTFFMDRIRASTNQRTFKEFLDVFCKKLNIEMLKIDTSIIDFLDDNNSITMNLLRKESLYIGNFAIETANQLKKEE